jgi:hypothetical protein
MRTNAHPGTSTGLVPGLYRDENTQPGTKKNALPDSVNTSIYTPLEVNVPGYEQQGVSHARVRAQAHDPTLFQPGTSRYISENSVQHTSHPGTNNPVQDGQPGTSQLITLIAHAEAITRSNPEIYPLLQNHPGLRPQARALLEAARAGEDLPTLTELASVLNGNLYRIRNAAIPVTGDKFTNGRAKDRLKRDTAQARTTAPSRQEKPMRATAAAPVKDKPVVRSRRIDLKDLIDQLEHSYELLLQEDAAETEVALRAYFFTANSVALHWIGGDPYTCTFPQEFQGQRLAKLCAYLRTLEGADSQALKEARANQLVQLRGVAWDNYIAECTPLQEAPYVNGECALDREILPFTWSGIDTLWSENTTSPAVASADYLPAFQCKASEDWHLVCLAVLFLNRACKYALSDLHPYPTGDGR